MRRLVLLTSLLFASIAGADPIDDYMKAAMERDHVPGACLAIIPPSGDPIVKSYGLANIEQQVPYSPATVHRVASVSKQFCAYAIVKLAREGKLGLTDALAKFFPKGSAEWSKITIEQMLAHRSGIADPGASFEYRREYTLAQYVELLSNAPLSEVPGEKYRYNNHAYALLGQIVGLVSSDPIESYVKKAVFDPIGMKSARYWDLAEVIPNRSDSYTWANGTFSRTLMIRPKIFQGSGGILMSMNDMLKYEAELRNPKVLDAAVLKQQWTNWPGESSGYGAGWFVSRPGGKLVVEHSGTTFGFTTYYLRHVDDGWTVILFRNTETGDDKVYANDLLRLAKTSTTQIH